MATTNPSEEPSFIERLKALANTVSMETIGVLVSHKPDPVPVHDLAKELGVTRSTASKSLARLRRVNLVGLAGRNKGYFAQTGQVKAVIGEQNYTRITQGFGRRQNEDAPGLS